MKTRSAMPVLAALAALMSGSLRAEQHQSAEAARRLVRVLEAAARDTIAAVDPLTQGTFVAALYIPGGQLLVVRAQHPSVAGIMERLRKREYRDVYLDLQATPTPKEKFFVQDASADGILSAQDGNGAVDILYEDGVRQTLFNGKPKPQQLTAPEYDAKLRAADAAYARLLDVLATAAEAAAAAPPVPAAADAAVAGR